MLAKKFQVTLASHSYVRHLPTYFPSLCLPSLKRQGAHLRWMRCAQRRAPVEAAQWRNLWRCRANVDRAPLECGMRGQRVPHPSTGFAIRIRLASRPPSQEVPLHDHRAARFTFTLEEFGTLVSQRHFRKPRRTDGHRTSRRDANPRTHIVVSANLRPEHRKSPWKLFPPLSHNHEWTVTFARSSDQSLCTKQRRQRFYCYSRSPPSPFCTLCNPFS